MGVFALNPYYCCKTTPMKSFLFLSLSLLLLVGCKKDKTDTTGGQLVFGTYYGECGGDCAHFFKIKDGALYPDNTDNYYGGTLQFSSTALPNDSFLLAKGLLDSLPQYMLNHADTTWGCPDCVDQGGIHIEYTSGDGVFVWTLDSDTGSLPVETRAYAQRVKDVVRAL